MLRSFFFSVLVAVTLLPALARAAEPVDLTKLIGVDAAKLTPQEKTKINALLAAIDNTRGCSGKLAPCIAAGDLTARRHGGYVARMVRKTKTDAAIAEGIKFRGASAFPEEKAKIDLTDRPHRGDAAAPITLVEYACFECPFCAHLAPELGKLEQRFGGKVVYYFKFFPVRSHKRGVPAALAAVAAYRQNKYWPMSALLFENRTSLEDAALRDYAKRAGLDLAKYDEDIKSTAAMNVVEKDKLEGMRIGVEGTPAFFVNGKLYQGAADIEDLSDRIEEEQDILAGRIK